MDKVFSIFSTTMIILAIIIFVADFEEFKVTYQNNCTEKKFLLESENSNIYLHCIEDIKVEDQKELYNFKDFVKASGMDEIYKKETNRNIDRNSKGIIHYYNNFVIYECNNESNDIVVAKRGITFDSAC